MTAHRVVRRPGQTSSDEHVMKIVEQAVEPSDEVMEELRRLLFSDPAPHNDVVTQPGK